MTERSPKAQSRRLRKAIVPLALLIGDTVVAFLSLLGGFFLRYHSPLAEFGLEVDDASFVAYLPLLLIGTAFLIGTYTHLGLYEDRFLLRRLQSLSVIMKGTTFWLAAYLSLSLVLKFDPPISRLFVLVAYTVVIATMFVWRNALHALLIMPRWRDRLRQRVAILGWNEQAEALAAEIERSPAHPYRYCGAIPFAGDALPSRTLGSANDLITVLRQHQIDIVIAARTDLPRDQLNRAVEACERASAEWKVIPSSFEIMLTGLRLQTIGRLPVLGIDDIKMERLFHRGAKRLVDLVGAALGLLLAAPVIMVCAILIRRESSGSSVLFRQQRVGAHNRAFTLYKLRSMRPDAEQLDQENQSTRRGDPRILRVGAFMRRWNLDELPQFWNVLRGEMSLVGPRPERPYHVDRLADEIPHYLPRHLVKPGMTGWAQVNGLRGESDLVARVQHDIYYIENWSLWLDFQILALTFFRWKNAY